MKKPLIKQEIEYSFDSIKDIIIRSVQNRYQLFYKNETKAAKSLRMNRGTFRKYRKMGGENE